MRKFPAMFKPDRVAPRCELARKFIKCLMRDGQLATAERVFRKTLGVIEKRIPNADPVDVFTRAIKYSKSPVIIGTARSTGGLGTPVRKRISRVRQETLAMRGIIQGAYNRAGRALHLRLAEELLAVYWRGPTSPTHL